MFQIKRSHCLTAVVFLLAAMPVFEPPRVHRRLGELSVVSSA